MLILFLLRYNFLDPIAIKDIYSFATQFVSYVRSVYDKDIYEEIRTSQDVSDELIERISKVAKEFAKLYIPPVATASK